MNANKTTNFLLISIATVIIFIYGKSLLIPFVIAMILWFLIKEIRNLLKRISFINNKIPDMALNLFGFILIFAVIGGIVQILALNIRQLSDMMPEYQKNITIVAQTIKERFNIDIINETKEFLGDYNYTSLLTVVISSIKDIFGKAFLIVIYTLFFLFEEPYFSKKIKLVYSSRDDYNDITSILSQIDISIGRYLSVKTLVSLITGTFSYIALLFIGIDAPLFWAFLIFLMNYIPAVGSLIATLFPAIFAMLQFGDPMPGLWTLAIVGVIQLIIGNYVDPRLMGNSLNVSPLVVILGLSFWGAIWGVMGMILSVPISVMMIIVFAQIPSLRPVAIFLSKNGNINKKKKK